MRDKGLIYSLEAVFIASIVLLLFMAMATFTFDSSPDYDLIDSMKVTHDMGEANTSNPPPGFYYGENCSEEGVNMPVYSFNGTGSEENRTCVQGAVESE